MRNTPGESGVCKHCGEPIRVDDHPINPWWRHVAADLIVCDERKTQGREPHAASPRR